MSHMILVVDDEQVVVRTITSALAAAGFRAVVAPNGEEGLEAFLEHEHEICLVLADICMPVMGGVEMARRIRERRPDAKIVLMTGYQDNAEDAERGGYQVMHKPFLPDALLVEVRRLTGKAGASAAG